MLPPPPMLAKKNQFYRGAIVFLALAFFVAGCTPPGPRALIKGRKFLERGDYTAAVNEFKVATSILSTNAQAWNYLGVACQHAGQPEAAAAAYQRAITLDRDLVEAHYNLGCLWLQQNKPEAAKDEFTAYTLQRGHSPEGWLKLGAAQLRLSEFVAAEKSFSTALYLNKNNAEALNGLGLARIERGRTREAEEFFAADVRMHPDYAPALLNLATVEDKYLDESAAALQHYRDYLALTPRPAEWNAVNAIVTHWERPTTTTVSRASASEERKQSPPPSPPPTETTVARTQSPEPVHPAVSPRERQVERTRPHTETETRLQKRTTPPPQRVQQVQEVQVQPEPVVVTSQEASATEPVVENPPPPRPAKTSVWHKLNPAHWFGSNTSKSSYEETGVTPLPEPASENSPASTSPMPVTSAPATANKPQPTVKPIHIVQPAPPTFPRYLYLSPGKPQPGNRSAAEGAFTQARVDEQNSQWVDAMESYRQAAAYDPSWFAAQYNYGVLAYRLHNYQQALQAFEMALAIQPDSTEARYNFALTLQAAGYALDAVNELKKIIAARPNDASAHLALGNLYAQQLRDPDRARTEYLKVLQLDPHNPQANDIRFWLSANPE